MPLCSQPRLQVTAGRTSTVSCTVTSRAAAGTAVPPLVPGAADLDAQPCGVDPANHVGQGDGPAAGARVGTPLPAGGVVVDGDVPAGAVAGVGSGAHRGSRPGWAAVRLVVVGAHDPAGAHGVQMCGTAVPARTSVLVAVVGFDQSAAGRRDLREGGTVRLERTLRLISSASAGRLVVTSQARFG